MADAQIKRIKETIESSLQKLAIVLELPASENEKHASKSSNSSSSSSTDTFSNASPSRFVSLSEVDENDIAVSVEDIKEKFSKIDAEKLLKLERCTNGAKVREGLYCQPIHNAILPKRKGCVRYLHIFEKENQYSLGIFVFPPNAKIPLHDHPGMTVLSRILYGSITSQSYDLVPDDDNMTDDGSVDISEIQEDESHPGNMSLSSVTSFTGLSWGLNSSRKTEDENENEKSWIWNWLPSLPKRQNNDKRKSLPMGSLRAHENQAMNLSAPDIAVLYPKKGNIHEFVAGEHGAAILDALLPPYDFEQDRECTFYKVEYINPDEQTPGPGDKRKCWLIPTEQPKNFHCISGTFESFGESDDEMDSHL